MPPETPPPVDMSPLLDHMLSQKEDHHAQTCGQMDTVIHQNEEMKQLLNKLIEAVLSLKQPEMSEEPKEPAESPTEAD